MVSQPEKKQNNLNLFLNDYFSIILALALILFLALAYLVFLGPKFSATQKAISANTEEKRILYEVTQKKLVSLKAVFEIYQKVNPADLQKFNSVLPDSYTRERLFGELEEIIGQGGWLLSSISISPEEKGAKTVVSPSGGDGKSVSPVLKNSRVGVINIQLEISAIDYPGFKELLRLLETNLRLFDVTSVNFSPSENSATVIMTTYYYQSPN